MQSVETQPAPANKAEIQADGTGYVNPRIINFLPHYGFLLGMLMWIVDALVDAFFLHPHEGFWESMFAEEPTEMWMRTLVIIVITVASLFIQHFMRKQYNFEMLLLKQQEQLEQLVHERTLELQRLANFDALTGIYNRRKFRELLDNELERARRYHQPLSVVLMDIDHFKKINDQHGHGEGDRVLESIAALLRNHLRKSDFYARWGGEEFIIMMTHTDLRTALQVAEKIRQLLSGIKYGNSAGVVTASFGISSLVSDEKVNSLIKRADDALYDAKHSGRNCIRPKE